MPCALWPFARSKVSPSLSRLPSANVVVHKLVGILPWDMWLSPAKAQTANVCAGCRRAFRTRCARSP
eukprot:5765901-Amphidinium_carterae.1